MKIRRELNIRQKHDMQKYTKLCGKTQNKRILNQALNHQPIFRRREGRPRTRWCSRNRQKCLILKWQTITTFQLNRPIIMFQYFPCVLHFLTCSHFFLSASRDSYQAILNNSLPSYTECDFHSLFL